MPSSDDFRAISQYAALGRDFSMPLRPAEPVQPSAQPSPTASTA